MEKIFLISISILTGILVNNYIIRLPKSIKEIGEVFKLKYSKIFTPIIVLINVILYIGLYLKYGISLNLFRYAMLSTLLLAAICIDYKLYIIPNGLNLFGFLYGVSLIFLDISNYKNFIFGFMFGFIFFLLIILLSTAILKKQGMGEGDLKLMAMMGIILGLANTILTTFLSFVIGSIISIVLLISKIKKVDDQIPFGPFIAVAGIITMFFGDNILMWYLGM